jgi:molybdenum cofactor synthesis domain-containing protein
MSAPARTVQLVVITVSDRAAAGIYSDRSGPRAEELVCRHLAGLGLEVQAARRLVPDERPRIARALREAIQGGADLILTTGGTGIGPRDVTPEATREVLEREIPGLAEAARNLSPGTAPGALLSRAVAGLAGSALILNLPGSVRAVEEYLALLLPALVHALQVIRGEDVHGDGDPGRNAPPSPK